MENDLKERESDNVEWIGLTLDPGHRQAFVDTVLNLLWRKMWEFLLDDEMTLLHESVCLFI